MYGMVKGPNRWQGIWFLKKIRELSQHLLDLCWVLTALGHLHCINYFRAWFRLLIFPEL
jgi:hypothetical protein